MRIRRAVLVAPLLLSVLGSCRRGPKSSGSATASPTATVSGRLTADRLHPSLHAIGGDDAVPSRVVFEFSLPVFDGAKVGNPSRSELTVEPDVPGTLQVQGPSTLAFTPTSALAFRTSYRFTLKKVDTRDGMIDAPSGTAWSSTFTTPDFQLLRLAAQPVDMQTHRVAVDLVFSGDVDAASVKSFVSVGIGGKTATDVRVSATEDRHVARLTITSSDLTRGAVVKVAVKKGLSPSGKSALRAPAAEMSFAVVTGLPVDVKMAQLKEGATGHYISVVCNDQAAGGSSYVWDPEVDTEYYVSTRCTPKDASAQEHIHFTPAAKFSVAPAQRGFNVYGDFRRGTYAMTIDPGLVTEDGGVVGEIFTKEFTISPRKPTLGFASTGRYLPRSAWKSLGIQHRNVDAATLTIRQIPPENLVFWMSDDSSEAATDRTSNALLSKSVELGGAVDEDATSWIDVASLLPSTTRGVLEISLSASGAPNAQARLLLTDMGIVAKRSASGDVAGWAIGLDATNPLPGVELSLIRKSGKVLARCTTDAGGGCKLPRSSDEDGPAFAILARKGEDLTYLKYADLKLGIADSEVQGEPYSAEKAYRASIYSDRGVYRPGDTAHLAAILRDQGGAAPPKGLPVGFRITDPRSQLAKSVVVKTNEGGMVSLDLPFEAFADTGRWEAKVSVADAEVGSYGVNVEEFVPERMKVIATTPQAGYALTDSVPVDVDARYLFGGSAEGSEVEVTCSIEPAEFHPKQNSSWQYGVWQDPDAPRKPISLGQSRGALDEKGHARVECPSLEAGEAFDGAGRLVANVSVFEAGSGRSTFQQASVPVHPAGFYVGLASATTKALVGKPVAIDGIVVDWNGELSKKAPEKVAIEFLRLDPQYGDYWDEEGGERYQQQLRPVREGATSVAVGADGKFHVDLTPAQAAAGYVIRARADGARTDLYVPGAYEGYSWNLTAQRVDLTPRPGKPTSLVVASPKGAKVGEAVTISVKSPYRGRALFTAETDKVVASEWKSVAAGENTWSFKLKEFSPNVYVSAFVVKDPHLESATAYMPDRAFGITSVPVEPTQFVQRVILDAPAEIRSNSKLTVNLDLGPVDSPTFATVAAVDEGILQLTRFKSPDPIEAIFARRALGVETFETIGWTLLMQPSGPSKSHGGDEDDGGSRKNANGRVQPVKPIALWSGIVPVGANGKATISFDVPTYRGQLRVMAVTSGAKRMGRASAQVQVADPIVVQTTLPRFLSQGDEFQVPVFLTNTTRNPIDVKVTMTAEDLAVPGVETFGESVSPIKFLGKPEGKTRLEAGKSATMVFSARAMKVVGAAKFRVKAAGGGFESKEELDVPFNPSGPREREVQKFEVSSSEVDLSGKLKGWIPTSEKTDFWLTSNPWGDSFENLNGLLQYPYGCIEQTTSTTWPLLNVSELIEATSPDLVAGKKLDDMVMFGVKRDLSMQTPSGGFAYWPGGTEPNPWGTAFATQMLLDAQKAGYPVPQERLDSAIGYMTDVVDNRQESIQRLGGNYHGFVGGNTEAYMHLVLALAGKGRAARVQKLIDELPAKYDDGHVRESAYMLKAALYLTGDHRYERDLKGLDASPIEVKRYNDWSYYSDQRSRGFMLSTFDDLFGNDPAGDALADVVASNLKGDRYYVTQEALWSVNALGKRVKGIARDTKPGVIVADGKTLEPRAASKARSGDRAWSVRRASELKSLKLAVKEKGAGKMWLFTSSEGVKVGGKYPIGGKGLKVHREFKKLDGSAVDLNGLHLADLVVVEVTITNESRERVQNIAMVDRLPAGFEIENARLGRGNTIEWSTPEQQWTADYVNVRDDRVEVFGALEPGETKKVVYAVRAVTSGTFTVPPLDAEAMYDPDIWAREGTDTVKIDGPWAGFLL